MLDHRSSANFDIDALAEALGSLPDAPLVMHKQVLEVKRNATALLPLLRIFGARTPRAGH